MYCIMPTPHLLPIAKEISEIVEKNNFRYLYLLKNNKNRAKMGWDQDGFPDWCRQIDNNDTHFEESSDALLIEVRNTELITKRINNNKLTLYTSERWLKPPFGILRVFNPSHFKYIKSFTRFLNNSNFEYLADGVYAVKDMVRLKELFSGKIKSFFKSPVIAFEPKPLGSVFSLEQALEDGLIAEEDIPLAKRDGFIRINEEKWGKSTPKGYYSRIKIWGYFVADSKNNTISKECLLPKKVLWIGRMERWKRVATIIKACKMLSLELHIFGHGQDEQKLKRIAKGNGKITFHDFVKYENVRQLMREFDTYVLSSDEYEGWGAVVSEALTENMVVLASKESGAGATLLCKDCLFRSGDYKQLAHVLSQRHERGEIREWAVRKAATRLYDYINERI